MLVLARPERYFPPTDTALAVLDARRLIVRRHISLPGFFTVDAISPDGRWLYLIQYAGENVLDYRVRALDTQTGRLAARDVVDQREPDEQMGGLPMARVIGSPPICSPGSRGSTTSRGWSRPVRVSSARTR